MLLSPIEVTVIRIYYNNIYSIVDAIMLDNRCLIGTSMLL